MDGFPAGTGHPALAIREEPTSVPGQFETILFDELAEWSARGPFETAWRVDDSGMVR